MNANELLSRSTVNLNQILGIDPTQPDNLPLTFSPYFNHDSLIKHLNKYNNSFKVLSLNCQSLNAKIDSINILLSQLNDHNIFIDAICLQETWLSDDEIPPTAHLNGYTPINSPKQCSEHGGLLIYLNDSYSYQKLQSPQSNVCDSLFIKITYDNESIILGNIYRPPHKAITQLETFNKEFYSTLQQISKNKIAIITGDFNINLLDLESNNHPRTHDFFNNVITTGFIPKITLPTRLGEKSCTLIDNCLCKIPNCYSSTSGILSHNISDHQAYFLTLDLKANWQPKPKPSLVQTRKVSQTALNSIGEDILQTMPTIDYNDHANPNTNYNIFISNLQTSVDRHCPIRSVKFHKHKHKASPWITYGIIKSIKERDKIYCKLKNTNPVSPEAEVLKLTLNLFKKILQKTIRQAKFLWYQARFETLKNNMKKTWGLLNNILHRRSKQYSYPDKFLIHNTLIEDKKEIANEFNSFFVNIGKNLASEIIHTGSENFKSYLNRAIDTSFEFKPISTNEVAAAIKNLKNTSSHGNDHLSSQLIKRLSPHIITPITKIINQSLKTGIFPDALKVAKVVPIFKKDDDKLLGNYRPISVLPTLSKVFERILHNQIQDYFKHNNLLYNGQYGFRPKHSTELAALELVDRLTLDLDKNEIPLCIFLDLSKAFDTINHQILLDKLKHYGFSELSLTLLSSYLNNRKQYVHLKNINSDSLDIHTGVPQGSILGPLLFIIYINDLPNSCSSLTPIIYADDTTLYTKLNPHNIKQSEQNINLELENVNTWLKVNKLSLNVTKTKFMVFHKPNKKFDTPQLRLNDTELNQCDSFNFLGLHITQHLTWTEHIRHLSNKISRTVGQLNHLKHILPSKILITLYNTMILPHLNYCTLIWGSQHQSISKLQKKCIRIVGNGSYNSHTEPIFKSNKLLKVEDIYQLQQLNFYFKLKNGTLPPYFNSFPTTMNHEIHQYNTRRKYIFPIRAYHSFTKTSLRYSFIDLVNSTPRIITDKIHTHSLHGFTNYTKAHFLNNYNSTCNIHNCYVCNLHQ